MKACLGIDTSCYTTSAALCCFENGAADGLFFQERALLTVAMGERGLMQSEGVFQHVTRLPGLLTTLLSAHPDMEIAAVCASDRPRQADDSYMPVFRVGAGTAASIAAALRVPLFVTTHQEGHIRAARADTQIQAGRPFLALHLSGGTTEILRVAERQMRLLGGTLDLHAGQLIDRVGVAMGLPFPAGPHLERLAMEGQAASLLPSSVRGLSCHFSGAEAQVMRWLAEGEMLWEDIAAEVFACVGRTVSRLIVEACAREGIEDALLGGGVASSTLIRAMVTERVAARNHAIRLHFARPDLAGDNAVGVAMIGAEKMEQAEQAKEEGA